jgi:hypothetical protein
MGTPTCTRMVDRLVEGMFTEVRLSRRKMTNDTRRCSLEPVRSVTTCKQLPFSWINRGFTETLVP